jgi:DNA mismatch endonuclease (patch repair protein)
MPKSRVEFWSDKFRKNVERDERNISQLRQEDWQVLVVWQCETASLEDLTNRLSSALSNAPDLTK